MNLRNVFSDWKVQRFNKRRNKIQKDLQINKNRPKPLTIILALLYSIILLVLNIHNTPMMAYTGENELSHLVITGCLFSLLIFIACLIVVVSNGNNFLIAIILQIIEISFMGMTVLAYNNLHMIPGFFAAGVGIIMCIILRSYILRVERNESQLDKATYTDALTGCCNRRGLLKLLDSKIEADKPFYLVFLDLDNFKSVNDTLGHDAGDDLLRFVTEKWSSLESYNKYTLARLGGDEFALVVDTASQKVVEAVADELLSVIRSGNKLTSYVTVSIGITAFPSDTRDKQKLLSYADTAMYKAKISGRNRFMLFDAEMYKEIVERYNMEKDVKKALDSNNFILAYQPQFRLEDKKLVGFEVLLRMKTDKGLIYPKSFIEVAEKSGLIHNVDLWVLEHALIEVEDLVRINPELTISLNISGKHLADANLITETLEALDKSILSPSQLVIEITESSYIRHLEDAIHNINKLRIMGCQISLDDFGTGYSSLSHLSKIPVNSVKISKAFIDNIDVSPSGNQFINIISKLGHLLGCKVIVEGVERQSQLEAIKQLDVDVVQGYIWGKPMELEEALSIIEG